MTRLGMIYHNALGVERDAKAAAEWWAKAVEKGDADAMAMLGAANHLGQGVDKDAFRAMVLLIMAREGGSPLAMTFFAAVKASLPEAAFADAEKLVLELVHAGVGEQQRRVRGDQRRAAHDLVAAAAEVLRHRLRDRRLELELALVGPGQLDARAARGVLEGQRGERHAAGRSRFHLAGRGLLHPRPVVPRPPRRPP